jgi:hypothetical protein
VANTISVLIISFAIFRDSTKRIVPDQAYSMVSTVGFAIFTISATFKEVVTCGRAVPKRRPLILFSAPLIVAQSSAQAELAKCFISAALLILGEDEDLLWDRHGTGVSPCPRA